MHLTEIFCIGLFIQGASAETNCGHPGLPLGSEIVSKFDEDDVWLEGSQVTYQCREGWVHLGQDQDPYTGHQTAKSCQDHGAWTEEDIECWENLAINQPSLQSGTFLDKHSHFAVDGDSSTCSYTLPTREQRWWQVQLQPRTINDVSTVSRIHVLTSPPSSVESVAVFVIKLLGSKAEYKQCHSLHLLNETNNGYMQFDCYQEHGEFVYIRDDRRTEEHLGICEVIVIPQSDPHSCGLPESPVYGSASLSGIVHFLWLLIMHTSHLPKLVIEYGPSWQEGSVLNYKCREGFTLVGVGDRVCEDGHWQRRQNFSNDNEGVEMEVTRIPSCIEMNCSIPVSPENGRVQVSTNNETFKYGATVFVLCDEGYVLSGNNTRQCIEGGLWTGPPPSCKPILCQNPPAVVNGLVELVNGTTQWKAVASYQCLPGFYNYGHENTSVVYSTCQLNGTWSDITLTCMAIPGFLPEGDIPWREKREVNRSTIITISILSVTILLIILIVITTIFVKRRKTTMENERKISTSSTNQLLYNQISVSSEKSEENNNDFNYDKLNRASTHDKDYSLMQQTSDSGSLIDEHIYSTLKKQYTGNGARRDSIDNDDDDDVYATVNFSRNSISVISDDGKDEENQIITNNSLSVQVTNDINELYAKIDVNKKRNRK